MRAARSIAIVVLALAIGASILAAALTTRAHQFYARSLFKVDIQETNRPPDLYGNDANVLRPLLDSRENHQALAKATMVDERAFTLRRIAPVRGTHLGCLEYSGVDSNLVQRVASNAARGVVRFYTTNQPGWQVTYIDSYGFTPPPFGQRLKRFLGF